jgi:hypothetical protein
MVISEPRDLAPPRTRTAWVALAGICAAVVLMIAAVVIPAVTQWDVHVNSFPPLHARWEPRVGPGTISAIVVAVLSGRYAMRAAARWPWHRVLLGSFLLGAAWMTSLATVDGLDGIGHILTTNYEYLQTARGVTDVSGTLHEYISRIPFDHPDNWPVHIAGHPPGALLFFVLLVRLGLGSGLAAGAIVVLIAATTPVAVLICLRRLGAEKHARRAAPFLVTGSAAIWMAVSGDALFGAVAAWGLCLLAIAATFTSRTRAAGWSVAAGLLLGYCVMLSYGLPLLGILAVAILLIARSWRSLPWAIGAAVAVVLAFALNGFAWWEAYPVLVERYWDGIASRRPSGYWIWGNLAALCFSAGPIVGASIAVAGNVVRVRVRNESVRAVVILTVAAALVIATADLSGMSKAEVERIWLPFVPWLLLGTGLLRIRTRQVGLAIQLVFALGVQHLLFTGW